MKNVIVIPARLKSSRLPRKVLADLDGRPMLWHVWQRCESSKLADATLVATDSDEICDVVESWGGHVVMTSSACRSGTERIASIIEELDGEAILNVQADEPLLAPELLDRLFMSLAEGREVVTPVFRIRQLPQLLDPATVKVVRGADGRALYFSRAPIPHVRDQVPGDQALAAHSFWGHVGIYGFRRAVLDAYPSLPEGGLEAAERLEQLRLLEAGWDIHTVVTENETVSVDTPEDLARVREMLRVTSIQR